MGNANLEIGTRIKYTGDMANHAAHGTITAKHEATKYSPESVSIEFKTPRFNGDDLKTKIPTALFTPGSGCRFMVA